VRVLLTGAGSGIGEVLADRLHVRGDELVLVARLRERAAQLAERWSGAEVVVADLAEPASLAGQAWPERLDGVVHAAGVVGLGAVGELDLDAWQQQLTVNLVAVAELTRLVLPAVRAARGTVVMVNSGAGLRANPGWAAYAASKHGLRALADALREEEKPHGVRVSSVYPGRTATPMQAEVHRQEGQQYDASAWIQPGTVADAVVHVLDLPRDATLTDVTVRTP
jgi:short-subunit dehydrogenase